MPAPSGKTAKGVPYPLETDGVDPPRDIKALSEFLDTWEPPWTIPVGGEAEWAGKNDPSATWMVEDGRELSRVTYARLFAAIGTDYGIGDGVNTFNIPDARGRVSIGAGKGPGLTERVRATKFGEELHSLTSTEMPSHSHTMFGGQGFWAFAAGGGGLQGETGFADHPMAHAISTDPTGGSVAHNNIQPSIAKNKIIRVL